MLSELLKKHSAVFQSELGKMEKFEAKRMVKANARPKFCGSRSVPFVLREAMKRDLDILEDQGVM